MGQHKEVQLVGRYLEGLLSDGQARLFRRHLDGCPSCRIVLAKHQALDALVRDASCSTLKVRPADKRLLMAEIRKVDRVREERTTAPILRWATGFSAVALLAVAVFLFQPSKSITVLSCEGDVSILDRGVTKPVHAGDLLKRGSTIAAKDRAQCLLSFGGNIMQLSENSSVCLDQMKKHRTKYEIILDLQKGRLVSNIKDKKIISSLIVKSGPTETRVTGTIFMVEKGKIGGSTVSVLKGSVSVSEQDRSYKVDSDGKLLMDPSGHLVRASMNTSDRDLYNDVIDISLYYSASWTTPLASRENVKVISDERLVYTVSKQGYVNAIDRTTGERLWQVKVGAEISTDPVVDNGKLYLNSSDGYCYIVGSGEIKSRLAFGPFAYSAPLISGGVLYLGNTKGVVTAFDLATEKTIWQKKMNSPILSNLVGEGDLIVVGTMNGTLCAVSLDGQSLWSKTLSGRLIESPASFLDGDIVIGTSSGDVFRVESSTGRQIWERHIAQQLEQPIRVVDGLLIVSSDKTTALDGKGDVKWTRNFSGSEMLVTEKGLMVSDGHLYLLDQRTGETRFVYSKMKDANIYTSKKDVYMSKGGYFEKIN